MSLFAKLVKNNQMYTRKNLQLSLAKSVNEQKSGINCRLITVVYIFKRSTKLHSDFKIFVYINNFLKIFQCDQQYS